MTSKTIKITHWALTILFSLAMTADAVGGITHEKVGVANMQHLQYPVYMMTIMGVAKIIGVIAILQTRFIILKEWAFAGFAISFIGAFWSRLYMNDGVDLFLPPVVMLIIMFVVYYFWKRFLLVKATK